MKLKKTAICTAAMVLLTGLCGCGDTRPAFTDAQLQAISEAKVGEDSFIITLYPDVAPITCKNFEKLVNEGFYNGLTFQRVMIDFIAQGGDPQGTGMGGSEETIKGEFSRISAASFPWHAAPIRTAHRASSSSATVTNPSWTAIMPHSARSRRAWRSWTAS